MGGPRAGRVAAPVPPLSSRPFGDESAASRPARPLSVVPSGVRSFRFVLSWGCGKALHDRAGCQKERKKERSGPFHLCSLLSAVSQGPPEGATTHGLNEKLSHSKLESAACALKVACIYIVYTAPDPSE